jgi:hypothetical protein
VFRLIHLYVHKLDPRNDSVELVELKFSFLRILSFHEFYVPLNMPTPPVVPAVPDIFSVFFKKHFLAGLLLAEVGSCIRAREKDMQIKAIITLRDQLYRHEHDARYQDPQVKERIAAIYFPFIPLVLDNWEVLQKYGPTDIRDWLICFLYILKGVGLSMQSEWLKKETPKRKLRFFDLLTQCIKVFEVRENRVPRYMLVNYLPFSVFLPSFFFSPSSHFPFFPVLLFIFFLLSSLSFSSLSLSPISLPFLLSPPSLPSISIKDANQASR